MVKVRSNESLLPSSFEEVLILLNKYNVTKFKCGEFELETVPLAPVNNNVKVMDDREKQALEAAMVQNKNSALFGIWGE